MSNISENRINVVIPAADITIANTSVATILSKIPENTTLTDWQRVSYNAIKVENKVFADDCLLEAQLNGTGILSPYVNLVNLQNDLTVYAQLNGLESALTNALKRISDAKRIAGHEAFGIANKIYDDFKSAHEAGISNATTAYEKLKVRYEAQGGDGGRDPETDV